MPAKESRGAVIVPLLVALVGVALLLSNFLLLGDFNIAGLLPLVLVAAGAQILLRGDLAAGGKPRNFGITRGSVESATLEISAGALDVDIRRLQREGRLIAGQFSPQSRPHLESDGTHATLSLHRSRTPWLAFVDWQAALANDLPWGIYATSSLGQINADLSGLIVQDVVLASGIGDIRLVVPAEALGQIAVRSAAGTIHITTPPGYRSRIRARGGRLFRIHADETRYERDADGDYIARDADPDTPLIEVLVQGTFGDLYLV